MIQLVFDSANKSPIEQEPCMTQHNIQYHCIYSHMSGQHHLAQWINPVYYNLGLSFIVLSITSVKSTGSERSTGEQRKVTGIHDEARVQVQVV